MRVHIDESRSERQTGSVDIPGIGNRKRRPGDRADPVVLYQNRAWYCRETWRPAFEMLSRALSEISRVRRTVSF